MFLDWLMTTEKEKFPVPGSSYTLPEILPDCNDGSEIVQNSLTLSEENDNNATLKFLNILNYGCFFLNYL